MCTSRTTAPFCNKKQNKNVRMRKRSDTLTLSNIQLGGCLLTDTPIPDPPPPQHTHTFPSCATDAAITPSLVVAAGIAPMGPSIKNAMLEQYHSPLSSPYATKPETEYAKPFNLCFRVCFRLCVRQRVQNKRLMSVDVCQ